MRPNISQSGGRISYPKVSHTMLLKWPPICETRNRKDGKSHQSNEHPLPGSSRMCLRNLRKIPTNNGNPKRRETRRPDQTPTRNSTIPQCRSYMKDAPSFCGHSCACSYSSSKLTQHRCYIDYTVPGRGLALKRRFARDVYMYVIIVPLFLLLLSRE